MSREEQQSRHEWAQFMEQSKMGQVVDMWDAHTEEENGAPRMSREKLEEMTARVRGANKETPGEGAVAVRLRDWLPA